MRSATRQSRPPGPLLRWWQATDDALASGSSGLPSHVADNSRWAGVDDLTLDAFAGQARGDLGVPWPRPTASHYARYFRDGDRADYEDRVAACQARLTRAVVLAAAGSGSGQTSGDSIWLDEVIDGIVVLCELSTWCWAAHERTCATEGTVVPDPDRPFVDLGAGEIAAQLAWTHRVLGALLDERSPGPAARMRREVRQRVLEPFREHDDWHWLGLDGRVHNWCPWICGNVIAASLEFDDMDHRAHTMTRAIDGLDRYLAALPADGSIDECYEYWWNGACRALEALELIEHAVGRSLDVSDLPVVRNTVAFPHLMHLGGDWYLNFADARARPPRNQPWHVLHRWARRVGDDDALAHAEANRRPESPTVTASDGLGRVVSALLDPEWADARPRPSPHIGSIWLPGTEVGVARERPGSATGLTMAIKGGHNDENHNHNDVGSLVVAVDGVPAIVDAGRPTYTAKTFGRDRYDIWTMQSTWHSVPEVCGTPQGQGRRFHARSMQIVDTAEQFAIELDLGAAYPVEALQEWWRRAGLDRAEHRVTVRDTWTFADRPRPDAPTTVHYLLSGEVESSGAGDVLVRPADSSRAVRLAWDPEEATSSMTVRALDDPVLSDVWGPHLTRLELRVPPTTRGALTLTVEAVA